LQEAVAVADIATAAQAAQAVEEMVNHLVAVLEITQVITAQAVGLVWMVLVVAGTKVLLLLDTQLLVQKQHLQLVRQLTIVLVVTGIMDLQTQAQLLSKDKLWHTLQN
jgi:beta-lactamase regulating signal transducer with metallopeptidase domain